LPPTLVCPRPHPAESAGDQLVARVNRAIAAGRVKNRAGRLLNNPSTAVGARRQDLLYPILDGIPILLADEAIRWRKSADGHFRRISMDKQEILAQVAAGKLSVDEARSSCRPGTRPTRHALLQGQREGGMSLYACRGCRSRSMSSNGALLAFADEIQAFLKEHDAELKRKER